MKGAADTAVVNPVVNRRTPKLGPVAVMASAGSDLDLLSEALMGPSPPHRSIYNSRLYLPPDPAAAPCLAGPMMGAPYAAAILESLVAWGAREIVFAGWCGAVGTNVHTGDIIVPGSAYCDEGTSAHYRRGSGEYSHADRALSIGIGKALESRQVPFIAGPVWTTDAVFRETRAKVKQFQSAGLLAVEMELSALFAVAAFRKVRLAGVLVVSDELSSLTWRPGFKDPRFLAARKATLMAVMQFCDERLQNQPTAPIPGS